MIPSRSSCPTSPPHARSTSLIANFVESSLLGRLYPGEGTVLCTRFEIPESLAADGGWPSTDIIVVVPGDEGCDIEGQASIGLGACTGRMSGAMKADKLGPGQ